MKSGIEMLEQLLNKIELLDRRFTVIEQNTKELLNRANSQNPKISSSSTETQEKTIKVIGNIKNEENKILIGVKVTIENDNKEIVKETKTNRAGEWMCFLPPGQYVAHYFLNKLIDTRVSFTLKPEHKILRVAQPKGA